MATTLPALTPYGPASRWFLLGAAVAAMVPSVAHDLRAENTISWAGTSALIANTVFQVLYGRLSDLFGRKVVFLSALALLSFSDLLCGLAVNPAMLYVFRALAGVAGGDAAEHRDLIDVFR